MVNAIIDIVIGIILIKYVPDWVKYGNKNIRSKIQLVSTIIGVLFLLIGVVSMIRFMFSYF